MTTDPSYQSDWRRRPDINQTPAPPPPSRGYLVPDPYPVGLSTAATPPAWAELAYTEPPRPLPPQAAQHDGHDGSDRPTWWSDSPGVTSWAPPGYPPESAPTMPLPLVVDRPGWDTTPDPQSGPGGDWFREPAPAPASEPVEDPDPGWPPDPLAARLITAQLRGQIASRLASASMRHAGHALAHLGNKKTEPGPYALMIMSAEYRPAPASPAPPQWWPEGQQEPDRDEAVLAPYTHIRAMTRLVPALGCPDLLTLLTELTQLAQGRIQQASRARQLFAHLPQPARDAIAAQLTPTRGAGRRRRADRQTAPEPNPPANPASFPYQQAVDAGLLWDPRTVHGLGFRLNDHDPITDHTVYLGVAVTSLDTADHLPWAQRKKTVRDQHDPRLGHPDGSTVPAVAWALLEDHTALLVNRRAQPSTRAPLTYDVTGSGEFLRDAHDQVTRFTRAPDLIAAAPRRPAADTAAATSRELWAALEALHRQLRDALYPASPTPDTTQHAGTGQGQP